MAGGSAHTKRDWLLFYFIFGCSVKNCMRERALVRAKGMRAGPYIKYTIILAAVHRWKSVLCVCVCMEQHQKSILLGVHTEGIDGGGTAALP